MGASDSSCLIRQGAVDEHEIGRRPLFEDLSGGGHAEEQAAAGDEELLGQQHGKRSAHRAADDAEGFSRMLELVEFSVVARPAIAPPDPSGFDERAQNIAVRIEQADLRNRGKWHILLPPRFAQQILRLEYRRRGEILPGEDRRQLRQRKSPILVLRRS